MPAWRWGTPSRSSGSTRRSWSEAGRLERLETVDGIVVPGGFGYRGIEGKIVAARYAANHNVPYLGLCLGMQVMCIEFARACVGQRARQQHRIRPTTPPIR